MNNIDNIIKVLTAADSPLSLTDITKELCRNNHIIYDQSLEAIVSNILKNSNSFRYSKLTSKWKLLEDKCIYVEDNRCFATIREAMHELFKMNVSSGGAFFKINNSNDYAWFPKIDNPHPSWRNTLSNNCKCIIESYVGSNVISPSNIVLEENFRYAFVYKTIENKKGYYFIGKFKNTKIQDNNTKIYELIDDKLKLI